MTRGPGNSQGTSPHGEMAILLVEQNARMALGIGRRGYVIQTGEIVWHDSARALLRSDLVRQSYPGEGG
ncbi:MAG: hypothetical protein ACE5IQ_01940 [Candidatus Methylomirabilales bacterium]